MKFCKVSQFVVEETSLPETLNVLIQTGPECFLLFRGMEIDIFFIEAWGAIFCFWSNIRGLALYRQILVGAKFQPFSHLFYHAIIISLFALLSTQRFSGAQPCAQKRVRAKQEMQISGVDAADRAPEESVWKGVAKNLRNTKAIYFYGLFQMFLISFISFCFLLNWDEKLKPGKSDQSGKRKPKYWREKKGRSVQSSSAFCMSPIVGVTVENV